MGGQAPTPNPLNEAQPADGSLNLRGEVNVQAMQDLGILILKGNEADVAKVEAIIKQLEEMSVGSLPDIHLLTLQHVNSESMAELMTSVYEKLAELRNRGNNERQTAAFIPVVQPNALLIIAPAIELEAVLQLADELDRRTDPGSEFKVFSLENAVASQVATAIEGFYEERGGLGTRVRVVADLRTNAIIVQGRANDLEEIAALIEKFDRTEPGAVHRVEIIELKHATAEELATTINTAIQAVSSPPQQTTGGAGGFGGANQAAQELRDGKSAALEFLTTTGNVKELIRSGILVDVRVNADIRSNSLIISAPEASMSLLKALVAQLDRSPLAIAEIKVFALRNADAEQSVTLLTSLFENQNQEDQLGVQIAGAEDAVSSLIPVQFSADIRTNTVLAVGSAESLSVVEAILLRLDTAESRQRRTVVIPMRNVQATIVAAALDAFLEQQQALQDSSEDLISNIERLRQEVIVAPDDNSNSLIVSASPEYFSEISQIITELDANPPQVVIQALLVEVQLDNTDEFGVELGFQDPTLFTRSIVADAADLITINQTTNVPGVGQVQSTNIVSQSGTPGFNFNNTSAPLGNNAGVNTSTVGTQGISNFSLGRQNGDLGFGGFVFSAQSDAVSVLVRALAARRQVHILSRPQVRTTHNNVASIQVGQQVPVVNGVTVTNNVTSPTIIQQNIGIILRVTPRVTPDGTISMEVYAEKSSLAPGGVPVFTDLATGNVVNSVIINSAIADTTVSVPNGQTIVIGGMITKSDETLERKVPWLGDLPLIGGAFRYDGTTTARSELLIFLTPRIIYSDADSELIKQVESERLHFIESEAEEIHGPLYSVPPSGLDHMMVPYDQMPPNSILPPYNDMPFNDSPEQAYPLNNFNDPGAIELPPQASASEKKSAVNPQIETTAKSAVTAQAPQADVQTVSQASDTSDSEDFRRWSMNRALSTATIQTADNEPANDAAAAEWVRQVLLAKQKREQQSTTTDSSKAPVSTESTLTTSAAETVSGKVTQAVGQKPESEPIRTMSASESVNGTSPPPADQKSNSSWMRRLLKPRKK
ncbi:MAG: secretin N-terminal domain-containing protein [Planctomycetaceae bacterium]